MIKEFLVAVVIYLFVSTPDTYVFKWKAVY